MPTPSSISRSGCSVADLDPRVAHIHLPQDNVSDDRYRLLRWTVDAGDVVAEGDVLGEFETSKSVFELPSPCGGFFHPLFAADQEVAVGALVAVVSPEALGAEQLAELAGVSAGVASGDLETSAAGGEAAHSGQPVGSEAATDGPRFSRGAEELIASEGLERSAFDGLGLVRRQDVERYLAGSAEPARRAGAVGPPRVLGSHVVVIGAGGHSKTLLDLLTELRSYRVRGVLDRGVPVGQNVGGHLVIGPDTDAELAELHAQGLRLAVNGVGGITDRTLRAQVWERLKEAGFGLPTLVHPAAMVDHSARLGEGAQVLAGAYVGADAVIGDNCIVNTGAIVAHDCVVGDHTHLAPGSTLAGGVTVGQNCLVGMGASVYLGRSIGADSIITNGVHVFSDVAEGEVLRAR
jgi:sugar O-acyltransferase (sialic acid O-acetyltransferase NeuD family)